MRGKTTQSKCQANDSHNGVQAAINIVNFFSAKLFHDNHCRSNEQRDWFLSSFAPRKACAAPSTSASAAHGMTK
jgi:hypothetical protein